ncbi:glycoside hydrolase family 13 protein [Pseudolysinimonas yzui]|uniref:Glucohydrolase n=1 Tax=Pseudolysinimonas yzui TaxID=2708254 RepID=A0A8J3M3B4_9MICO|nr:alpha-glucosidase [Pseudolysinimonas yzui]GHF11167.1 glucohydrolase [Pseudolysinimonas yzui]
MKKPLIAGGGPAGWWRSAVVYQVYVRSFADSDGDGIGDLGGILSRLDHLEDLGVDVVWLGPFYPSPHDDNGYDISDYRGVDPVFGTLEQLDTLLAELHRRGIRLILDLVVNHTSDEHPWFRESSSGPQSAKRDWYWWRPSRPGCEPGTPGAEPNNWESFFSGPAWEFDRASGEYFLHLFSRRQPDLNWENPDVREAVYDIMNWWLDRGVDGFRMDVINFISKDPHLPDGVVRPGAEFGDGFPFFGYGPRIHRYVQEMHRRVFAHRPGAFLTVGEMPGVSPEQAARFTDPARGEFDMVFQFEHMGVDQSESSKWQPVPFEPPRLIQSLVRWQDALAETGWNSLYWNNHDQPRVVSRFGDPERYWYESATALAAVLHLQRGTPFVYQGEELGMTNMPFTSLDEVRDIESLNHARKQPEADALDRIRRVGRDNARTPMQWTDGPAAGFTTGIPWIGVNPNSSWLNARSQRRAKRSVYEFYRRLIQLRHTLPVVVDGAFVHLPVPESSVFAFVRRRDDEVLLVTANLSSEPVGIDLAQTHEDASPGRTWTVELGNYDDADPETLRAWEVVVTRALAL